MTDPDVIYLEPWCETCDQGQEGRMWCENDEWDECVNGCGRKSTRYVRAEKAEAERDALRKQLETKCPPSA